MYNAILKDFGAFSDGLTGVVDDGVGVVLDGASEVVLVADLDGLAHRRSYPRRHFFFSRFTGFKRLTYYFEEDEECVRVCE